MDWKFVSGNRPSVFIFIISALLSGSASAAEVMKTALAGKAVSVEGRVLIRQERDVKTAAAAAKQLVPGDLVKEGDVINTSSDGKAKLMLEDKTILDLGPSALFKVLKFNPNHGGDRQVSVSMEYGTVRASVSKPLVRGGKFQIHTRSATMGVRGTEFIVQSSMGSLASMGKSAGGGKESGAAKSSAPETKVTVVQGKVEVAQAPSATKGADSRKPAGESPKGSSAPVMLTAGTQLVASANAPASKPVTISAAEMKSVTTATKIQDNTFTKAVSLDMKSDNGGGNGNGKSGGGDSSAGQATRAAVSQAINLPQSAPVLPSNSGFIGTFSPTVVPNKPPAFVPVGGPRNIRIVVRQ